MTTIRLVAHQFRYDQRTFWREPAAVFFTVALPLIFLILFVAIFGNEDVDIGSGETVRAAVYYVPGILTLAIVSATTVNLAIGMTGSRERGALKRLRSTPLPPWVFFAGRVCTASVVSLFMVVLLCGLGRIAYDVDLPIETLPGLLIAVAVGTASGCFLGFALSALIPSVNAAPAVTNAIMLPLYFVSGIFVPEEDLPDFMQRIGDVFWIKHLFEALLTAFDPATDGAGIAWSDIAIVAAWGLAGLLIASRAFRWTPRGVAS
jgi:ABC-2 type transport system permease protein